MANSAGVTMTLQSHHVFEPRPGELVRDAISRSHGTIALHGGDTRYRVVDLSRGTEFIGSRDQCIDFVELAWWRAETAPTPLDQVHESEYAIRLRFERNGRGRGGWERDPYLSATITGLHSF